VPQLDSVQRSTGFDGGVSRPFLMLPVARWARHRTSRLTLAAVRQLGFNCFGGGASSASGRIRLLALDSRPDWGQTS
jgi:hypothetical protein